VLYPKREQFFAHRFIRLLTKTAAALELGSDGCWLLTVIAMQEDACRYTRPVNFFNSQLIQLCHLQTEKRLRTLRDRCKNAGWLLYEPSNRRKPGRYMVSIPIHAMPISDGSCDESLEELGSNVVNNRADIGQTLGSNREADGQSSIPSPIPSPSPRGEETPFDQGPSEPADTREQWRYERRMDWASVLLTEGAKLGPLNWTTWKRIVADHGLSKVLGVVKSIPADDRWPDKTEIAVKANGSQDPSGDAIRKKTIRIKT
jgi:hypothetical protein